MSVYALNIFRFRLFLILSFYLLLNVIGANPSPVLKSLMTDKIRSTPFLKNPLFSKKADNFTSHEIEQTDAYKKEAKYIKDWMIAGDVFLVLLLVLIILGFLTVNPGLNFFVAMLHFLGIILLTLFFDLLVGIEGYICAIVFGLLLPFVIEILQIVKIFLLKGDFY